MDLSELKMTVLTPSLAIVVPCYNEEEVFPKTLASLQALLAMLIVSEKISTNSKIYLVDDGSRDSTWTLLKTAAEEHTDVVAIKLSRNKGHQNALYAGLRTT